MLRHPLGYYVAFKKIIILSLILYLLKRNYIKSYFCVIFVMKYVNIYNYLVHYDEIIIACLLIFIYMF